MKGLQDYSSEGQTICAPEGAVIFAPGDESHAFLIVTSGTVRVEQTNNAGRTVVLYRVTAGNSCMLTTTCLLSERPYSGFGYAESDVEAAAIAPEKFRRLMRDDAEFQELVFQGFASRIGALTDVGRCGDEAKRDRPRAWHGARSRLAYAQGLRREGLDRNWPWKSVYFTKGCFATPRKTHGNVTKSLKTS